MSEISELGNFDGIALAGRWRWPHLLALPAGLLILTGCGKTHPRHTDPQPLLPAVQVRTQTVEAKPLTAVEEVVGTVRARLHATVEARTSGRISTLPVVLGQKIRKGELLARLDAPEVNARLDQAEAGLRQAERDWNRISSLFGQQVASQAEYDAADTRYLAAKGALDEARAMTGYLEIPAPFDGVVTKKWADVGDLATPGKPLLELEDPTRLQLEAEVPEAIASNVHQNARLTIRANASMPDFSGSVAEMAPTADPVSRTFQMKLDLPATPGLRSGQFARLLVPVGETPALRVPACAVVQRGQMEMVFAVENQRARLHLVKTGRRVNDEIEILSGLDSGESVVIDPPQQLVQGQPVQDK